LRVQAPVSTPPGKWEKQGIWQSLKELRGRRHLLTTPSSELKFGRPSKSAAGSNG
jgi:hypothetical protein